MHFIRHACDVQELKSNMKKKKKKQWASCVWLYAPDLRAKITFILRKKNYRCSPMECVLCDLDVRKCHRGTAGYRWCVVLSVTVSCGHARGPTVTGNSLCAGVMEVAMWNNLMKWFLFHLLQLGHSIPCGPKPISITFCLLFWTLSPPFSLCLLLSFFPPAIFPSDDTSSVRP